ncbi:MAG: PAS domain-containing sensor histidine kinase [Candidatus Coatesbacteria bacterium]|nr:MAG: PAS domain-containing sensor histidine kinase [Candidatus Coatesbacteria bacterium]
MSELTRTPEEGFKFGVFPHFIDEKGKEIPCVAGDSEVEKLCGNIVLRRFDPDEPRLTKNGSFWTGDAYSLFDKDANGYKSLAIIPFIINEENIGLLQLKSLVKEFFSKDDLEFYEGIAQSIGTAVDDRRAQFKLRERVKEMTCLYGIAKIASQETLSTGQILKKIVDLFPPAMQYPEITEGRIVLYGVPYTTEGFEESPYKLSADITVNGVICGVAEVFYREEKMSYEAGLFLQEEQSLIDGVARQVGLIIENRLAEEERATLQGQLRHADRLATIGQLAAGVAHEINEPLGAILGFAQFIGKTEGLPRQVEEDAGKIVNASLHVREIVKKLLIFASQMPTKKSAVNLNKIIEEGLLFLESRCAKEDIELVRSLSSDIPDIVADPGQLNQILVNLVVNAIQSMPDGGTLTISTGVEDECVFMAVEDTGIGMPDEVRNRIFLPFYTTKDVGHGTGLGLPVVHGIVTSHGGTITVKTELGKGSRFKVRLPIEWNEERGGRAENGAG